MTGRTQNQTDLPQQVIFRYALEWLDVEHSELNDGVKDMRQALRQRQEHAEISAVRPEVSFPS